MTAAAAAPRTTGILLRRVLAATREAEVEPVGRGDVAVVARPAFRLVAALADLGVDVLADLGVDVLAVLAVGVRAVLRPEAVLPEDADGRARVAADVAEVLATRLRPGAVGRPVGREGVTRFGVAFDTEWRPPLTRWPSRRKVRHRQGRRQTRLAAPRSAAVGCTWRRGRSAPAHRS